MAELLTSDSRVWCQTLFEPRDTCWNLRHLFRSSALVTFERTVRKKPAGWAFWATVMVLPLSRWPRELRAVLKKCLEVVATSLSGFPLLH